MTTLTPPPLTTSTHGLGPVSDWVKRWSPLVTPRGTVLDIACGQGRHLKWFAERGHAVTGLDRSPEAIAAVADWSEAVLADLENAPWPLIVGAQPRQFDAVIVTNYLWRPLFSVIVQSLAPGGLLIYETFAKGNEQLGKPSRPDFLLQPAELLSAFANLQLIAFEEGRLDNPPRVVQRLVARRPDPQTQAHQTPQLDAC